MNNYEILKEKLNNIRSYIMEMDVQDTETKMFLQDVYRGYIERLISAIDEKTLPPSNGAALLGLIRGLSDYDEIDKKLLEMVADADNYFCYECTIEKGWYKIEHVLWEEHDKNR